MGGGCFRFLVRIAAITPETIALDRMTKTIVPFQN
jgi:hypothetical protein